MGHVHQLLTPNAALRKLVFINSIHSRTSTSAHVSFNLRFETPARSPANFSTKLSRCDMIPLSDSRHRLVCWMKGSDTISQLEIGRPEEKRLKQVNGVFWIILLNLGIFAADHWFQVQEIKSLYLYRNWPSWYQFVTATFCHANWNHLSSNLFFLYIFGKLVEEEEGNFALWLSYILTGAGANLVSWLVLRRNAISVGASSAVFGLFAISVLAKMSWDWRKILEVLILGQFVVKKVMEAAQASTGLSGKSLGGYFPFGYFIWSVNNIAHFSGALIGVGLVWILSKVPALCSVAIKLIFDTSSVPPSSISSIIVDIRNFVTFVIVLLFILREL